jgi:uncharacterized RDD family membrane protein YckC
MTTADDYISRVLIWLPGGTPLRSQIAMELRAHIAERVADGHSMDDVLKRLGDPRTLAESYLSAVPLVAPSFMTRAVAKIVDVTIVVAALALVALLIIGATLSSMEDAWAAISLGILIVLVGGSFVFAAYTIVGEARFGRTLGKHWLGLRVVTESGTKISAGQAFVRQLPMFLQIYMIDVLFALFTEKSQRAFELLSKTRVIIDPGEAPAPGAAGR